MATKRRARFINSEMIMHSPCELVFASYFDMLITITNGEGNEYKKTTTCIECSGDPEHLPVCEITTNNGRLVIS